MNLLQLITVLAVRHGGFAMDIQRFLKAKRVGVLLLAMMFAGCGEELLEDKQEEGGSEATVTPSPVIAPTPEPTPSSPPTLLPSPVATPPNTATPEPETQFAPAVPTAVPVPSLEPGPNLEPIPTQQVRPTQQPSPAPTLLPSALPSSAPSLVPEPTPLPNLPAAPAQLSAEVSGEMVSLAWVDQSDNEHAFVIELRQSDTDWQRHSEVPQNQVNAQLQAASGAVIQLRVKAENASGGSVYSNVVELTIADNEQDQPLVELGSQLWRDKGCLGCHDNSLLGETADGMVRNALNQGRTSFEAAVNSTMPFGAPGACEADCAEALAAWLYTLYPQLNVDEPGTVIEVPDIAPGEAALMQSLYKVSLGLGFERPKAAWQALVAEQGEAGLDAVVREIIEQDNFYIRLREIYAPSLQGTGIPSNAYASSIGGRANWFNDYVGADEGNATARHARQAISDAVNNEPLRLIEYVVRNNLPFTDILTADYTLVNYYSARAYNLLDSVSFTEIDSPENANFPYDSQEYKKAYLPIPTAGILTSSVFVTRYPTNEGNVNRHRAYTVYKLFLDTDILDIPGSRVDADDITVDNPTLNNATCTGCHNVMDPVSSTFRHWQRGESRREDWQRAGWDQSTILPPGFNGVEMPAEHSAPLQWLAQQIATDPRFAVATVKTLFTPITGHPLLSTPAENASDEARWRYQYQQEQIQALAEDFIEGGYQVKELVVDLVLSDYFRNEEYLGGTRRLLSSEAFKRKVQATLGLEEFGGVRNVITGETYLGEQPSGVMTLMQRLAASEIACRAIAPDLLKPSNERLLLPHFVDEAVFAAAQTLSPAKEDEIKLNLQHLMWQLWGQQVAPDNAALLALFDIYLELVTTGLQAVEQGSSRRLGGTCDARSADGLWLRDDPHYAIRAWLGIVNLMVDDFRFLYH